LQALKTLEERFAATRQSLRETEGELQASLSKELELTAQVDLHRGSTAAANGSGTPAEEELQAAMVAQAKLRTALDEERAASVAARGELAEAVKARRSAEEEAAKQREACAAAEQAAKEHGAGLRELKMRHAELQVEATRAGKRAEEGAGLEVAIVEAQAQASSSDRLLASRDTEVGKLLSQQGKLEQAVNSAQEEARREKKAREASASASEAEASALKAALTVETTARVAAEAASEAPKARLEHAEQRLEATKAMQAQLEEDSASSFRQGLALQAKLREELNLERQERIKAEAGMEQHQAELEALREEASRYEQLRESVRVEREFSARLESELRQTEAKLAEALRRGGSVSPDGGGRRGHGTREGETVSPEEGRAAGHHSRDIEATSSMPRHQGLDEGHHSRDPRDEDAPTSALDVTATATAVRSADGPRAVAPTMQEVPDKAGEGPLPAARGREAVVEEEDNAFVSPSASPAPPPPEVPDSPSGAGFADDAVATRPVLDSVEKAKVIYGY